MALAFVPQARLPSNLCMAILRKLCKLDPQNPCKLTSNISAAQAGSHTGSCAKICKRSHRKPSKPSEPKLNHSWPATPIKIAQAKHHATTPASLRAENPQSEVQQSLEASAKEILQARTQQSLQAKAQEIPWGRACKNLFKPAWDMAEARVKPACSKDSVQAGPQHSLAEMPTTSYRPIISAS